MSAATIDAVLRHPVKGLDAETLPEVILSEGRGLPLDRAWAFAHGASAHDPANPGWLPRRNFVVVAHSPRLVTVGVGVESAGAAPMLTLAHEGVVEHFVASESGDTPVRSAILDAVAGATQPGPYRLVGSPRGAVLTDHPVAAVSIMNARSLAAFEAASGHALDRRRFRGNLWLDGCEPWEELDWVGRTLVVGEVRLEITEPIVRCAAVDADPVSGVRDLPVLKSLQRCFGHVHFGVLATVVSGGRLAPGEALRIL